MIRVFRWKWNNRNGNIISQMKLPYNVEQQQQQLEDQPTKNETGKQAILFVSRKKWKMSLIQ